MNKKISKKYEAGDDEAFERYLYVIGTSINKINQQMEELDA